MRLIDKLTPKGYVTIPQHEYDLMKFKSEHYDKVDSKLNEGMEYVHRLGEFSTDYTDGMYSAYMNIYKELGKDELRQRTRNGRLFSLSSGSDDIAW